MLDKTKYICEMKWEHVKVSDLDCREALKASQHCKVEELLASPFTVEIDGDEKVVRLLR